MPPSKRSRPDFSPPRPRQTSKAIKVSTAMPGRDAGWKNAKNAAISRKEAAVAKKGVDGRGKVNAKSKYVGREGTRAALLAEDDDDDDEERGKDEDEEDEEPASHSRSRKLNGPARSALDLLDRSADEDDEDEAGEEEEEQEPSNPSTSHPSSPEPDFMIAEITTDGPLTSSASQQPIPDALVHKMLHQHFEQPGKTAIARDAREVVGKYLEVFVREAIMRSAFERGEREGGEGGGGVSGGFLEVEDLERCAVQLCLDF